MIAGASVMTELILRQIMQLGGWSSELGVMELSYMLTPPLLAMSFAAGYLAGDTPVSHRSKLDVPDALQKLIFPQEQLNVPEKDMKGFLAGSGFQKCIQMLRKSLCQDLAKCRCGTEEEKAFYAGLAWVIHFDGSPFQTTEWDAYCAQMYGIHGFILLLNHLYGILCPLFMQMNYNETVINL
jgi:hypothetical protein